MQWTHCSQVHNLDFADDIGLLSHNYKHAQDKIQLLATTQEMTALTIKRSKTKAMRINSAMEEPIKLNNKAIEDVSSSTYLGSDYLLSTCSFATSLPSLPPSSLPSFEFCVSSYPGSLCLMD